MSNHTIQADIKIISQTEAHEIINGGGANWVYFPGDDFDASIVEDFVGGTLHTYPCQQIDAAIEGLQDDEALVVHFN